MISDLESEAAREAATIWVLSIDGSSRKEKGGAGIVVNSPFEDQIRRAVTVNFPLTNNEVEYEVLVQ
ncbi:hypothetical protein U1Q18_018000, partial [Sarracenia purpurea var. burkii]